MAACGGVRKQDVSQVQEEEKEEVSERIQERRTGRKGMRVVKKSGKSRTAAKYFVKWTDPNHGGVFEGFAPGGKAVLTSKDRNEDGLETFECNFKCKFVDSVWTATEVVVGMKDTSEFVDGVRHGASKLLAPDGGWLELTYEKGVRNGKFVQYDKSDGSKLESKYVNDLKQGFAVETFPNGKKQEFNFVKNKRHGLATLYPTDGVRIEFKYVKGVVQMDATAFMPDGTKVAMVQEDGVFTAKKPAPKKPEADDESRPARRYHGSFRRLPVDKAPAPNRVGKRSVEVRAERAR